MNLRNEYLRIKLFSMCPGLEDEVIRIKRKIREYTNRVSDRKIVKDNGIDGYILLIELPDCITSKAEAEEHFKKNEYIPTRYSAFDCTGYPFTSWYKIIKRRSKFFAYHCIAFDV